MEKESHRNQLAPPPTNYLKIHEELTTNSRHRKRSSKCLVYILLAVVLHSIAFLIFGLVVLRVKNPSLQLSSAAVRDLRYESASLNMTVVAGIRLDNMNFFGDFDFRGGGSATLLYGNATVGAASIGGGRVGGREKREMDVAVKVICGSGGGGLAENYMNFSRDIGLGFVKLRSFAELRGEVSFVKIVKRRRTAFMNCTMDLNLTSQGIQNLSCQ